MTTDGQKKMSGRVFIPEYPRRRTARSERAAADRGLRRRLGQGGVETLRRTFDPKRITATLAERILGALERAATMQTNTA